MKVKFFKECQKDNVLATPILTKIIDQTLLIRNKVLNVGFCKAINGALKMVPTLITKLTLDSNGLEDKNTCILIEGMAYQQLFKVLTIRDNEVDESCIQALAPVLKRKMPSNLDELHLIDCKISWKTSLALVTNLKQKCYLRKLSLVKASLNEFSIKVLGEALKQMKTLTDLDISWNQLVPKQIIGLVEVLSQNKKL